MPGKQKFNPYAAPISSTMQRAPTGEPRIEGNCIVVSSWIVLPMRCIATNVPCDTSKQQLAKLSYAPTFRLVLRRRYCRLTFCRTYSGLWIRALLSVALFSMFSMVAYFSASVFILFLAMALAAVPFIPQSPNRLKIVKHKDGEFWIKGFHADFLQSLVEEDGWQRR